MQKKHRLTMGTPATVCSLSLCKSTQPIVAWKHHHQNGEWRKGCQDRSRSPTFNQTAKFMKFTKERVDLYPKEHGQCSGTRRNPCHGSGAYRMLALGGKQAYLCRLSARSAVGVGFSFSVAHTCLEADTVLLHYAISWRLLREPELLRYPT